MRVETWSATTSLPGADEVKVLLGLRRCREAGMIKANNGGTLPVSVADAQQPPAYSDCHPFGKARASRRLPPAADRASDTDASPTLLEISTTDAGTASCVPYTKGIEI